MEKRNSELRIANSELRIGGVSGGLDDDRSQDRDDLIRFIEKRLNLPLWHELALRHDAQPVVRLACFFKRNTRFGNEVTPALSGFRFFEIRADACSGAKELVGGDHVCSAPPREHAMQSDDATCELEHTVINIDRHHS